MSLLSAKNLVKAYGKRRVVDRVSFDIFPGEIVGLLGPNGAGKTTSFLMVVGMVTPDQGQIYFRDANLTSLPMYKRSRLGLGYLSQEPSVFRKLTVEQNILAILETLHVTKKERRARLTELLDELGLNRLAGNLADTLSGGERRRLEITRALVTNPSLILLDEPFSGVDPIAVADIKDIITQLKRKRIGILLTDHNVRETLSITDRSYIIAEGRIIKHGTPMELIHDEQVRKVYLGEKFTMAEAEFFKEEEEIFEEPMLEHFDLDLEEEYRKFQSQINQDKKGSEDLLDKGKSKRGKPEQGKPPAPNSG